MELHLLMFFISFCREWDSDTLKVKVFSVAQEEVAPVPTVH